MELGITEAGLILSILVLAFSIYKFGREQKHHHQIQEDAQEQFNEIQEKAKNLEFMKLIESYSTEFINLKHTFLNGPVKFTDCEKCAKMYLSVLDRLSFFCIQSLISEDVIDFFHNDFGAGVTLLKWLKITNTELSSWCKAYPNFVELSKRKELPAITISHPFYYYLNQIQNNRKKNLYYNPFEDPGNPKIYKIKEEDIEALEK